MTSSKPRLAIIGCGAVVETHLYPALRRAGWRPSVLVDVSEMRRNHLARQIGGKNLKLGASWEDLADHFDAAIVAAPHCFHGPIGRALVQRGKHVFMEKPLATSSSDATAMVAEAEAAGVCLSVGLLRRYLAIATWTRALIGSGVLGEIQRFDAREGFTYNWATSSDALLRRDLSGGGVLMDTGAHTLDLLRWWFGELAPTSYRDDAPEGVEADCVLECRTPSGTLGRVELSRTRNLRNSVMIEGSRGYVEVQLYENRVVAGSPAALAFTHEGIGAATMPQQLFPSLFDAEIRDFLTSASTGRQTGVSGREGVGSVALVERCYQIRSRLEMPWGQPSGSPEPPPLPRGARAVVTGASGFIGGRLAERLVAAGLVVTCPVRSVSQAARLARLPVTIVRLDLADPDAVSREIAGADYVFHCAYDPRSRSQNIDALKNIIAGCLGSGVKRLVHVSTFSVYEPFPDGKLDEQTRDGNRKYDYVNVKLDLEAMVLDAVRDRGIQASIVQPTIVYGPFSKPWTNAPAEMLIYGDVILPGAGEGLCNPVHIDDLVDGMMLAATRPEAVGERFILTGPEVVTWRRFFEAFARALNVKGPSFRPPDRISAENHGLVRDIRMVLSNPKRLVQIAVRWPPARHALQSGLEALPRPLRRLVDTYYFGSGGPKTGGVFLPDPRTLALYVARPSSDSEKARRLLGYAPSIGFEAGMEQTSHYLRWAYGDLQAVIGRETVARVRHSDPVRSDDCIEDRTSTPQSASAGSG